MYLHRTSGHGETFPTTHAFIEFGLPGGGTIGTGFNLPPGAEEALEECVTPVELLECLVHFASVLPHDVTHPEQCWLSEDRLAHSARLLIEALGDTDFAL